MLQSSLLMVDGDSSISELFASDLDYPSGFKDQAHPQDYKSQKEPTQIQYFHNSDLDRHRAICRLSWRLGEDKFVTNTFICDSGAPVHLYLNRTVLMTLREAGRLLTGVGRMYVIIDGVGEATVRETPPEHRNANIMGFQLLTVLGFRMSSDLNQCFTFDKPIPYL